MENYLKDLNAGKTPQMINTTDKASMKLNQNLMQTNQRDMEDFKFSESAHNQDEDSDSDEDIASPPTQGHSSKSTAVEQLFDPFEVIFLL